MQHRREKEPCMPVEALTVGTDGACIGNPVPPGSAWEDEHRNNHASGQAQGNNNIAQSIFDQMRAEQYPEPAWVVMSAGTGGTSATIGRYIRYRNFNTRLCVVDVEHSAFYECFVSGNRQATCLQPSRIEGIGWPRVEPSFVPSVIDHMIKIPDAASIAAMHPNRQDRCR